MDQKLATSRSSPLAPNRQDNSGSAQGDSDTFAYIAFSHLPCAGYACCIQIHIVSGSAFEFIGPPNLSLSFWPRNFMYPSLPVLRGALGCVEPMDRKDRTLVQQMHADHCFNQLVTLKKGLEYGFGNRA